MKKKYLYTTLLLSIIIPLFPGSIYAAKPAASIDYVKQGDTMIANSLTDINNFVTRYKTQKQYFTNLQIQQIESQYNGTEAALNSIKANLDKDSGNNLQNDYNAIGSLYIYEAKLPVLYSQLYTYKATYLDDKFNKINTNLIQGMVSGTAKPDYQKALNISQQIGADLSSIQSSLHRITSDYSAISDAESVKNTTTSINAFKSNLQDIKQNQKQIQASFTDANTAFLQLINLS